MRRESVFTGATIALRSSTTYVGQQSSISPPNYSTPPTSWANPGTPPLGFIIPSSYGIPLNFAPGVAVTVGCTTSSLYSDHFMPGLMASDEWVLHEIATPASGPHVQYPLYLLLNSKN